MKPMLCVVLHDVAPATRDACTRVLRAVRHVAPELPLTLLAVPRYHCERTTWNFAAWLREAQSRGHEIALHGYTHQDDGVPRNFIDHLRRHHYTRGEGEFADLTITEASRRLSAGQRWFGRYNLTLHGFVAPAWLMSPGTWEALRWTGIDYTCTLRRLVLLPECRGITSQALVYSSSSAWRRQASRLWNATLATTLRGNPLLRLELHPGDADHRAIRRPGRLRSSRRCHERRIAATLAEVAHALRQQTEWAALCGETLPAGLGAAQAVEPRAQAAELDDHQHEHRGDPADERTDRDIARVVQPEHHA